MGALAATVDPPAGAVAPRRGLTAPPHTRYTPWPLYAQVRGAQPAPTPPVRHGTCRLTLTIDGTPYRLSSRPRPRRLAPQANGGTPQGHRLLRPYTQKCRNMYMSR